MAQEMNDVQASETEVATPYIWQVIGLMIYYSVLLLVSLGLLFNSFSANPILLTLTGPSGDPDPVLESLVFTILGGLLGSVLYGIRTLFYYYAEEGTTYDPRWLPKYFTAPLEGAGLAVVVLAVIQSGAAAFGGSLGSTDATGTDEGVNFFTAFATGALVGYGTRNVVHWLGQVIESTFAKQNQLEDESSETGEKSETKTLEEDSDSREASGE